MKVHTRPRNPASPGQRATRTVREPADPLSSRFSKTRRCMAEGNAVSRAITWIIARYKSVRTIALRAIVTNLLSLFDLASDLYTIESLFALGHNGPACALLTMVCVSFAVQVRADALS